MKAFAPVNIAWIKYMGKENGLPSNSSLSMTLAGIGTETEISRVAGDSNLSFEFAGEGYVPPETGREKSFRFLRDCSPFQELLRGRGFDPRAPSGLFRILTRNSAPAGAGIATSASGFAALTLAWIPHFLTEEEFVEFRTRYRDSAELRAEVAALAGTGSGSACRSFHGPFVEWKPGERVVPCSGAATGFVDFILLLDSDSKEVPSSEAHLRVRSSPRFFGRAARAEARLEQVKMALRGSDLRTLSQVVLEEALDMHELFHTSLPPFRYWNRESEAWRDRIESGIGLPSPNGILTFDAGANAHLFVPEPEAAHWEAFLVERFPELRFLRSGAGTGAEYR